MFRVGVSSAVNIPCDDFFGNFSEGSVSMILLEAGVERGRCPNFQKAIAALATVFDRNFNLQIKEKFLMPL